jgi:hypothetical protein
MRWRATKPRGVAPTRSPVRRTSQEGGGAPDEALKGAGSPREESRSRTHGLATLERRKTGKPLNGKPGGPKPTRPYATRGTLRRTPEPPKRVAVPRARSGASREGAEPVRIFAQASKGRNRLHTSYRGQVCHRNASQLFTERRADKVGNPRGAGTEHEPSGLRRETGPLLARLQGPGRRSPLGER